MVAQACWLRMKSLTWQDAHRKGMCLLLPSLLQHHRFWSLGLAHHGSTWTWGMACSWSAYSTSLVLHRHDSTSAKRISIRPALPLWNKYLNCKVPAPLLLYYYKDFEKSKIFIQQMCQKHLSKNFPHCTPFIHSQCRITKIWHNREPASFTRPSAVWRVKHSISKRAPIQVKKKTFFRMCLTIESAVLRCWQLLISSTYCRCTLYSSLRLQQHLESRFSRPLYTFNDSLDDNEHRPDKHRRWFWQ